MGEDRDGIIASFEPEGHFETLLAERIASLLWRLNRAVRYETEITAHNIDDIPEDMAPQAAYGERALGIPPEETITLEEIDKLVSRRMLPSRDTMEKIMRCEAHLRRQFLQILHELESRQARRKGERPSPLARLDVSGSPFA